MTKTQKAKLARSIYRLGRLTELNAPALLVMDELSVLIPLAILWCTDNYNENKRKTK